MLCVDRTVLHGQSPFQEDEGALPSHSQSERNVGESLGQSQTLDDVIQNALKEAASDAKSPLLAPDRPEGAEQQPYEEKRPSAVAKTTTTTPKPHLTTKATVRYVYLRFP